MIDEKDKLIRKLQFKLQKLEAENESLIKAGKGNSGVDMVNFYKEKLSLELRENDRAFELLLSIYGRVVKLVDRLRSVSDVKDQSSQLKGLINIMDNASFNESKSDISNFDEPQNMESAQSEVINRLEELEYVCDMFHQNFMVNKKQSSDFEKKCKDIQKDCNNELTLLNRELKEVRDEKESLKSLLQKNEKDKNHLISKINNTLDAKTRKEVEKMSREELIEFIKRLMFKNSELETVKNDAIKEVKKTKAQDLEKYKKILNDVKLCQEVSRLGKSMM